MGRTHKGLEHQKEMNREYATRYQAKQKEKQANARAASDNKVISAAGSSIEQIQDKDSAGAESTLEMLVGALRISNVDATRDAIAVGNRVGSKGEAVLADNNNDSTIAKPNSNSQREKDCNTDATRDIIAMGDRMHSKGEAVITDNNNNSTITKPNNNPENEHNYNTNSPTQDNYKDTDNEYIPNQGEDEDEFESGVQLEASDNNTPEEEGLPGTTPAAPTPEDCHYTEVFQELGEGGVEDITHYAADSDFPRREVTDMPAIPHPLPPATGSNIGRGTHSPGRTSCSPHQNSPVAASPNCQETPQALVESMELLQRAWEPLCTCSK